MAYHKSAKKRARQTGPRTSRNTHVRTGVKSAVKAFRDAVNSGDKKSAPSLLAAATRTLRRAGSKGVIHQSAVSRRVSRLAQAFNRMG